MSLQVWLPLNGDLHNQGLSGLTATNNGATVNNNGKIGKCYSFNGTDNYFSLTGLTCAGWPELSIACWCYPVTNLSYLFLIRGNNAHRVRISGDGLMFRDNNNSSQRIIAFGATIPQNTWSHLVCIYKRGEVYIYINGVLTAHSTTYYHSNSVLLTDHDEVRIGRSQSTSGNSYYNGRINDFRIYNHALSAAEVAEIAKGLVLHYKLDYMNLINKNTLTENAYINTNGTFNTTSGWYATDYIPVQVGKTYQTIGLSTGGSGTYIGIYNSSKTKTRTIAITANQNNNFTIAENETYVRLSIRNFNNELKDALFYEVDTTIYDCSGYQNNGTVVGNLTAAAGSPKYDVATQKVSGSYIRVDNRPNAVCAKDAITVSMWVNFSTWSNCISCTDGGGWNFEEYNGGLRFPIYIASVGYKIAQSTITSSSLKNAWHMLTGTMDSNNIKFYIDGEEVGTVVTGSTNGIDYANNYIFIGGEASGNNISPENSSFEGKMSDVRIYATALTSEQVADLFHTSMSIDANGNAYARELVEN